MEKLKKWLDNESYALLVGNIDPINTQFESWLKENINICLSENKANLLKLFYFSMSITRREFDSLVPKCISDLLQECDLLFFNVDLMEVSLKGVRLNVLNGLYIFAQPPTINQSVYFGADSIALARNHPQARGKKVLDLCCGPGTQGLLMAVNNKVLGVDINPVAIHIASINSKINLIGDNVEFIASDLRKMRFEGREFDYICMNPPLIPVLPSLNLPIMSGGGEDGFELTWFVIEQLQELLASDGVFRTLGTTYTQKGTPILLEKLERLAKEKKLAITWFTISEADMKSNSNTLNRLANTYAMHMNRDLNKCKEDLIEYLEDKCLENLCAYYLQIKKSQQGHLEFNDYASYRSSSCWSLL